LALIGENGCGKTPCSCLPNWPAAAPTRPDSLARRRCYQRQGTRPAEATGGAGVQTPSTSSWPPDVAETSPYGLVKPGQWTTTKFSGGLAGHSSTSISEALVDRPGARAQPGEESNSRLADVVMLEPELLLLVNHPLPQPAIGRAAIASAPTHSTRGTAIVGVASHDLDFLDGWARMAVRDGIRAKLVLGRAPRRVICQKDNTRSAFDLGIPPPALLNAGVSWPSGTWKAAAKWKLEALERLLREPEQSDCNQNNPPKTPGLRDLKPSPHRLPLRNDGAQRRQPTGMSP